MEEGLVLTVRALNRGEWLDLTDWALYREEGQALNYNSSLKEEVLA